MRALYEISEDLRLLEDTLLVAEDEEAAEMLASWADELRNEQEAKVEGVIRMLREAAARAEARRAEAQRFTALAQRDERLVDRLKKLVLEDMESLALRRLETPSFRLSRCRNGGLVPIRFDPHAEPADVDERWQRLPPPEWDTEAIRAALEAGEELEFAALGERGHHLRIA